MTFAWMTQLAMISSFIVMVRHGWLLQCNNANGNHLRRRNTEGSRVVCISVPRDLLLVV